MNGKPKEMSDYFSEDLCNYLWGMTSSYPAYSLLLAKLDQEFEQICDDCEERCTEDCERESRINEGHL